MANSRKLAKRPPEYVVIINGYPAHSNGRLVETRNLAIRLRDAHKKDAGGCEIGLYVRDWSAPGGLRLVKDYSVKPKKHKPSKFMRDLRKELGLD